MPIEAKDTTVFEYPTAKRGINIHKNIVELYDDECLLSQNLRWENGMVKRGGQTTLTDTEVVSSKKILGLHRFYYGTNNKQLLAACDTTVKYYAGSDTWTNVKTGLTTGLQTYMTTWGPLDKAYICNGTEEMHSWNGSATADFTLSDGVPTMALPYQDRLLTIIGGDLTWSDSFSDTEANWETIANCGVRPDNELFGMVHHSATNVSAGYEAKVLLGGSNGMYFFAGTDLRVPSTTGDYTIYPLATNIGCNAPRTMQWTPFGTMYLGIDKQVYLIPFRSSTPIPIGTKIHSNFLGTEGIENIPTAQIKNACAVYHNGYYILSYAKSGQTTNTAQFWLDVTRMSQDEDGHWGPWYGPMVGQTISCFATQNGTADSGELMAGESTAKGYVYQVNQDTIYGDIDPSDVSTKDIEIQYQTYYNPLGSPHLRSDVHRVEAELLDVLGTVNVDFHDISGSLKTGDSFSLSGSAIYWDDLYWNEFYWSSSNPTRVVLDILRLRLYLLKICRYVSGMASFIINPTCFAT